MKKVIFIICLLILPINFVSSKSISDLYNEISYLEDRQKLYNDFDSLDIDNLSDASNDTFSIIDSLNDEVNEINKEISSKEEDIKKLNDEVDSYMVFNQISRGENIYLEYVFDSDSYSNMIYRYMIVEQMSLYNNDLISKLNDEIKSLEDKKNKLNDNINKLTKEREKYRNIETILKKYNSGTSKDINTSIEEEIASIKREINMYESLGCNRYIDLRYCINIPNSMYFNYPLEKGCVTSNYGNGHLGIDLACNKEGSNVYSSLNGIVSNIRRESNCGGNVVYIYSRYNNKNYTTIYGHLLTINVSLGDYVTSSTIIGTVGGESTSLAKGGYDRCTNGAHLHYAIVEGFHTNDFSAYTVNPRYFNNYPGILDGYFMR